MHEALATLFDVDVSDPSRGIRISLKKGSASAAACELVSERVQQQPALPLGSSPYGVHIVNGRVVRESRHADSQYSTWAPITGPAAIELQKKPAGRKRDCGPPIPLDQLEYVIVDVETTGGAQIRGHRITEVAIVRLDANGKKTHEYSTLVNPGRSIPYPITKLTSISDEMVRAAPFFEDVAHEVRSLLEGRVFVAHNAAFDWGFLHGELVRTTGKPLLGRRLCTVRLARKVVPEVRRRSLDALSYFFNVHNEARHRAYGDARATALIFRRLLERVREREIESWQALDRFVRQAKVKKKRSALPTPIEDV